MGRPTPQQWDTALDRSQRLADRGETLTAEAAATAARLGVAERTVLRRLSRPGHPRPSAERGTGAPADLRAESSASLLNLGPVGPIEPIEPIDLAHMDVREEGRPW